MRYTGGTKDKGLQLAGLMVLRRRSAMGPMLLSVFSTFSRKFADLIEGKGQNNATTELSRFSYHGKIIEDTNFIRDKLETNTCKLYLKIIHIQIP